MTGSQEDDQATVDIYAESMAPMLGTFTKVGLKAYMLEGVAKYSEAAEHAGYGLKDVSVVFDMIRSRHV